VPGSRLRLSWLLRRDLVFDNEDSRKDGKQHFEWLLGQRTGKMLLKGVFLLNQYHNYLRSLRITIRCCLMLL
jgi:hypothetical protein